MPLVPYALTTLDRAKVFLGITGTAQDTLLTMLINQATGFLEGATGRRFASTTYTDEKYNGGKSKLFLRQYPVSTLSSLQYRQGTISAPTWVSFPADDYMLYGDEGYIQFLFGTVQGLSSPTANGVAYQGTQNINVTYTAGYLIDWAHEDDPTKHNLPPDLEAVTLSIVGRMLNTRKASGISSESVEGASISYDVVQSMSAYEQGIIQGYTRINL